MNDCIRTADKVTIIAALALLLGPAVIAAQDEPIPPQLPADAELADEIRQMDELERRAGRDPVRRVTSDHLRRVLTELGERGMRQEALEHGPLPSAGRSPRDVPELADIERGPRVPREPGPVTREHLLGVMRDLPGGREMLEEARRRGAPISVRQNRLHHVVAALNPFRVEEAWAQNNFSLTLTPSNPRSSSPYGVLAFYGGITFNCCSNHRVVLQGGDVTLHAGGVRIFGHTVNSVVHSRDKPFAQLWVSIPSDGWYVLSFRGYQQASMASLHLGTTTVRTINYSNTSASWRDYPVLLNLQRGTHRLRLAVHEGSIQVSQVNVMAY